MSKAVTTFLVMPPNDLNDDVVKKAVYLEDALAAEFPGYIFEITDLRRLKPADPGAEIRFGDGTKFAVIPLIGQTSDKSGEGFYLADRPPASLVQDITEFCGRFDFEKARRYAA